MPMVYIWMHEGKTPEYRRQISDGIHAAMMEVLKTPEDVLDHFLNELPRGNIVYDPNYFDVPRSPDIVYIHFFFNTRPKEQKAAFFEKVADEVTARSGLKREDLIMAITEVPAENWWAYGRTIDPGTGLDTRMKNGG